MRYLLLSLCFLIATVSHALSIRTDAPSRYVVQPGDSLWSISCRFLNNPWEWKQLWLANPNIKNPNRLYSGDVLMLDYYQDAPFIRVLSNGTVKLSPNIRISATEEAVPAIPLEDIKPFLDESLILDEDVLSLAPYVVALMGEHMLGGQGDEVYVRGLHPSRQMPQGSTIAYSIFRAGKNYIDPITKALLGYKATLVGYGELAAGGEPATVLITSITVGVREEDKVLINNSPEFDFTFMPQTPSRRIKGFIIDMPDGMPTGNNQEAVGGIVVINLGVNAGLCAGDVLGIYAKRKVVKDPKNLINPLLMPAERIGEAMVFRAFTNTSFALVVRSTRAIYLLDSVTNP